MKTGNNVVTIYWDEDEQPERLRDVLCSKLFRNGVIKAHDRWTIEDGRGDIRGAFYHITGPKLLVDFLAWLTNLTSGQTHMVNVETDETGQINRVQEL